MAWWRHKCETSHLMKVSALQIYNVGYEKCFTWFLTLTMVIFDRFSTTENRNEYSTQHVQTVSLQPDYVSTLPSVVVGSDAPVNDSEGEWR